MPDIFDIYDKDRVPTGKTALRGAPLRPDEYRIAVHIWIQNASGQWLISKRAANKSRPMKWEPTGGCVLTGEDSLQSAVREVREELGIALNPADGILFASFRRRTPCWENPGFLDVWMFKDDTPVESMVLQPDEVLHARWASLDDILGLIASGDFVPTEEYDYHSFLPECAISPESVRIARIRYMESVLDRVLAARDQSRMQRELAILEAYYFGPLWMQDYEADDAGLLPKNMKRGVLCQDAVYDLFTF